MEADTLSPPPWLEAMVRFATPPLAREAVLGDLCETYVSPQRYARDAVGIVPFVIFSQLRRHLNLPVLLVQLEHKSNELAVMYGYLAPVNLFSSLTAD